MKKLTLRLRPALYTFIPFLLLLLFLPSCKPCDDPTDPECPNYCVDETNPECPNYDPCWDQTEVSAEFRIMESSSYGLMNLEDTVYYDSVVWGNNLITEAIHEHPDWTYEWKIGSEVYDGMRTALKYSTVPYNTPIPIQLIVHGPPNTTCFPEEDGKDTLIRTVVFKLFTNESTFYHGYLNGNPQDTITIGFTPEGLYQFKRDCFGGYFNGVGTYKRTKFISWSSSKCDRPTGEIVRDPDKIGDFNHVEARYTLQSDSGTVEMLFEGRTVQ